MLKSGSQDDDLVDYLMASPPLEIEGFLRPEPLDEDLAPTACEQMLDKLLMATKEQQEKQQQLPMEQEEWEESFNELFPDLV